jgi:putrescine transport system substrate-binding protein
VALKYLHLDPGSSRKDDLEAAAALLTKIRPSIRKFESSEYINDLANGDICIAFGYSSDINLARRRAREANRGVNVVYKIPIEGSVRWIDTIAIPKDAEHVDAALRFLDFILRPEVIADTSNAFFIMSGNADAAPFLKPEITSDPEIMPPASVEANLFALEVSTPEIDRLRTRLWTRIKTGR